MRAFRDELPEQLAAARDEAAKFLALQPDSVALVRNVSEGVSVVLESLGIGPGDDVVVSNHGYPTAGMAVQARGAAVVEAWFDVGATPEQVVEAFADAVTPTTRLVIVDQITSPTALVLPSTRSRRRSPRTQCSSTLHTCPGRSRASRSTR
jgi:isopenicillin-N epimerase